MQGQGVQKNKFDAPWPPTGTSCFEVGLPSDCSGLRRMQESSGCLIPHSACNRSQRTPPGRLSRQVAATCTASWRAEHHCRPHTTLDWQPPSSKPYLQRHIAVQQYQTRLTADTVAYSLLKISQSLRVISPQDQFLVAVLYYGCVFAARHVRARAVGVR